MRPLSHVLVNTGSVEIWPARLLSARSSRDARALAQADLVLRRKADGAYLAANLPTGVLPLVPRWTRETGIDDALDALDAMGTARAPVLLAPAHELPLDGVRRRLASLGIDADAYAHRTALSPVAEPSRLALAGRDRYRRPLWLRDDAARAWQHMQRSARSDGIALDAISGYRSHAYQAGIIDRKLARGDTLASILRINAAPGFSEHHSGRAIDIGAPGQPAADASFETTAAFAWLQRHAANHGFTMTYPRDNPHGIVFEPWHWAYGSA